MASNSLTLELQVTVSHLVGVWYRTWVLARTVNAALNCRATSPTSVRFFFIFKEKIEVHVGYIKGEMSITLRILFQKRCMS